MNVVRYVDRPDLVDRRYEELTRPAFPQYMKQRALPWDGTLDDLPSG